MQPFETWHVSSGTFISLLILYFWLKSLTTEAKASTRIDFVASFPFPEYTRGVLIREYPELSTEVREQAWEALRQYFLLHTHQTGRSLGMPSEIAAAAWRAFICSREYKAFCNSAFGKFLHYIPCEKAAPCSMNASFAFKDDIIATWKACTELRIAHPELAARVPPRRLFQLPSKEIRLAHPELALVPIPLLFSLDAEAGSGWIHTPESLAALERQSDRKAQSHVIHG